MTEGSTPSSAAPRRNRLAAEQSPYLRQHADNPVDWFAWGEEAFARARATGRPIFLSIGYSTCHWCHVMAHESFEDPAVAEILNRDFVSVKVDREERPDVDRLYMAYVQATTGHGGWPMSVWLTPDLAPFFGGTYFPPADAQGRIGFPTLLGHIAEAWRSKREQLVAEGNRIIGVFREHAAAAQPEPAAAPAVDAGQRCLEWCFEAFDDQWGGFGGAPKFPRPSLLNFLFRVAARRDASGEPTPAGREALRFAELTLQRMAEGGMRDHVGGGFHRYSVDGRWHVPHFEKMLYDQAQLVCAYLEGFQATDRGVFGWIARETIDYVLREMTSPGGGFYSAEDADSDKAGGGHGEGAFYVWTQEEIRAVCGPAAAGLVEQHYGVRAEGNAQPESDPQGEFRGTNILHQAAPLAQTSSALGIEPADAETRLLAANEKLLRARAARPRPHLDDKVLTAWNGLMISSLARAIQVLGPDDPEGAARWESAATRAAEFVERELHDAATSRLWRGWRESRGAAPGFAEDYAFLVQGLLDLYEATGTIRWLQWADRLQETMDADFWDANAGGYFSSPAGDPHLLVRMKEDYDGAEPAANSVAALNLLRLDAMLGGDGSRAGRARETLAAFRAQLDRAPHGLPQMLVAVDFAFSPVRQIVIAGDRRTAETQALLRAVHGRLEAPRVILWASDDEGQSWLAGRQPWLAGVKPIDGCASVSVCRDNTCGLPVTDPEELAGQLA